MDLKEKIISIVGFGIEPERAEIMADAVISALTTDIIPKLQDIRSKQDKSPIKEVYVVSVTDTMDDYLYQRIVFCTAYEDKARDWCSRYNKLITDRRKALGDYYNDEDYSKQFPLWYDEVMFHTYVADYRQIQFR